MAVGIFTLFLKKKLIIQTIEVNIFQASVRRIYMESFHTSYEAKLLLDINCFNGPLSSGLAHVIRAWPPESGLIWSAAMSTLALWTRLLLLMAAAKIGY